MNSERENPIRLRVASPCSARWEDMTGDQRIRFCSLCCKNVYNLSGMSREEIRGLLERTGSRICVRFFQRADGTVLTDDCPRGLVAVRARLARIAALATVAFLGIGVGLWRLAGRTFGGRGVEIRAHQPFTGVREWADTLRGNAPPASAPRTMNPLQMMGYVGDDE